DPGLGGRGRHRRRRGRQRPRAEQRVQLAVLGGGEAGLADRIERPGDAGEDRLLRQLRRRRRDLRGGRRIPGRRRQLVHEVGRVGGGDGEVLVQQVGAGGRVRA